MVDVLSKSQRKTCMSHIRGKDTKPEILLRKALWKQKLRYRLKNNLPGHPDIIFPSKHLAIFVDGCFWHCCPIHFQMPETNHDFWEKKLTKNKKRDKKVNLILDQTGWKVIRFWEHEIKNDLSGCVEKVAQFVKEHDL